MQPRHVGSLSLPLSLRRRYLDHRRVLNATTHDRPTAVHRARQRSVQLHTLPLPYLPFVLASILSLPRHTVLSSAPLYAPTYTRTRSLAQVSLHPTPTVHGSRCYRRTRNPELCPGRTIWIFKEGLLSASEREYGNRPPRNRRFTPLPIRRCPLSVACWNLAD